MPEFNAIESSDLIVAGRVTGWDVANDIEDRYSVPLRIHLAVDETFKGSPRQQVDVVAFADAATREGQFVAGTDCSAFFPSDPTGYYYVLGLMRRGNEYYAGSVSNVMFSGEEPNEEYHARLRAAIEEQAAVDGRRESDGPSSTLIAGVSASLVLGLLACIAAWVAVRRRRSA